MFTVNAFAVLMIAFVQATDKYHVVGILGYGHGFINQLSGGARVLQVDTGEHAVVSAGGVAYVSAGICHLVGRAGGAAYAVKWRYFIFGLE